MDDKEISEGPSDVQGGNSLAPIDKMYFGGFPNQHSYREVTNTDFDGCIDEVTINGNPVDLSQNMQAYGVTPGCPVKVG